MAAPYLRTAETELDLSEGMRLQAGQQWDNTSANFFDF